MLFDIESPYYWVRHLISMTVWLLCLAAALFGILKIAQHIGGDVLPVNGHFSSSVDAARAAASVGEHRMAVEHFSRAIAIDGSKPELWLGRAISRLQLKDSKGTLEDIEGALARGLPEQQVLMLRAKACQLDGKTGVAIAQLDRIIEADPKAIEPRKIRASLHADNGSLDRALSDVDAILSANPADNDSKTLRAEIGLLRADWQSASSAFLEMATTQSAQPKHWIGAGVALLGSGAYAESQVAFEKAQEATVASPHVRSAALLGQALALRALERVEASLNAWNAYSTISRKPIAPRLQAIVVDDGFLKRIYFDVASRAERDDGFIPTSRDLPPSAQP